MERLPPNPPFSKLKKLFEINQFPQILHRPETLTPFSRSYNTFVIVYFSKDCSRRQMIYQIRRQVVAGYKMEHYPLFPLFTIRFSVGSAAGLAINTIEKSYPESDRLHREFQFSIRDWFRFNLVRETEVVRSYFALLK